MAKVTGFGGVFFKSRDPQALSLWYAKHLGVDLADFGGVLFREDEQRPGYTLWAPFAQNTRYFEPSGREFMLNFRVDDLSGILASLRSAGVQVDAKVEDSEFGRFGWIEDPEGTRVELWQPPANK
jgi:predicted enzyme related to lactoylglutathione lyase